MTAGPQRCVRIGTCVGAVLGRLAVTDLPESAHLRSLRMVDMARDACSAENLSNNHGRGFLNEVVTYAAIYVVKFMPGTGWGHLGSEVPLRKSRADLAWRREADGGVLIDEIKTGHSARRDQDTLAQARKHLSGARDRWGADVLGVRVLSLAKPNASQMFGIDGNRPVLLASTKFFDLNGER